MKLSEWFPDVQDFEVACDKLQSLFAPYDLMSLNDIYYALTHLDRLRSRDECISIVEAYQSPECETEDSVLARYKYSYNSVYDPDMFNTAELNKLVDLLESLESNADLRAHILEGIRLDVEEYPNTEMGGFVSDANQLSLEYMDPRIELDNDSYLHSYYILRVYGPTSLALFHQHATEYDSAGFAKPSIGASYYNIKRRKWYKIGDIISARHRQIDGVMIAALSPEHFAVYFYNERGDVAFLGAWDAQGETTFDREEDLEIKPQPDSCDDPNEFITRRQEDYYDGVISYGGG